MCAFVHVPRAALPGRGAGHREGWRDGGAAPGTVDIGQIARAEQARVHLLDNGRVGNLCARCFGGLWVRWATDCMADRPATVTLFAR